MSTGGCTDRQTDSQPKNIITPQFRWGEAQLLTARCVYFHIMSLSASNRNRYNVFYMNNICKIIPAKQQVCTMSHGETIQHTCTTATVEAAKATTQAQDN